MSAVVSVVITQVKAEPEDRLWPTGSQSQILNGARRLDGAATARGRGLAVRVRPGHRVRDRDDRQQTTGRSRPTPGQSVTRLVECAMATMEHGRRRLRRKEAHELEDRQARDDAGRPPVRQGVRQDRVGLGRSQRDIHRLHRPAQAAGAHRLCHGPVGPHVPAVRRLVAGRCRDPRRGRSVPVRHPRDGLGRGLGEGDERRAPSRTRGRRTT